jgi:hypothetical protein
MTFANSSTAPRSGLAYGLMALLIPCAIAIFTACRIYSSMQPASGLTTMSWTLTLLTIVTIAGLWLRKPGALWLTLIVVSFAATLTVFFWSMDFHRMLVAMSVVLLCAICVLTFRLGPSLGRSVGVYQRVLFACVLSFAGWVAFWGLFRPTSVARAIPFTVPPLHARFLGAMYLSGAVFMFLGMLGRQWHEVRVVTLTLAVWTGMLGIVSLFHLELFNWSRDQVWFWFFAYICFPLVALWVAWCQRSGSDHPAGAGLADALRFYLYTQGTVAVVLAVSLLFAPQFMTTLWPWKIPVAVAHIYGAPFLSFSTGSLYAARQRAWSEVRIQILGTLVFAVGVLTASRIHIKLFNFQTPSAWIWFGGFGLVSVALLLFCCLPSLRTRS